RAKGACCSWLRLLAPDDANGLQLPSHRAPGAVEPLGDLVLREALHLPDGNLAQGVVAEQVQQALILFGDLSPELPRGLVAHHLREACLAPPGRPGVYPRWVRARATAATPAVLVGELVEGLAGGDDHQQPPQVVPVAQLREASPGQPPEEAVEGILDDVL